jgi:hypothetical protein
MNAEVAAFLDSLKTGNPPAAAVPLLRAVWPRVMVRAPRRAFSEAADCARVVRATLAALVEG